MVEEGIKPSLGMADYHAWTLDKENLRVGPISCSMLKSFDANPYAWKISEGFKKSEAMRIGSLFDAALTDPDALNDPSLFAPKPTLKECVVSPYDSFRSGEAQKWRDEELAKGSRVVSQKVRDTEVKKFEEKTLEHQAKVEEELARARRAAKAVIDHPIAGDIMRGAELQVGVIGEIGGIPAKCLLDILPDENGEWAETIVDYKTTGNGIDDESIRKTIGNFKYHWQAAFYRTLFSKVSEDRLCERFVFIFQDVDTLEVRVVILDDDAMALGTRAVRAALKKFATCAHNGIESQYLKTADELKLMPYHEMNEDENLNNRELSKIFIEKGLI